MLLLAQPTPPRGTVWIHSAPECAVWIDTFAFRCRGVHQSGGLSVHCSSSTRACAPCIMFHHRYSQSSVPTPSARPRRSTHPEGRRELPHEALAYRRARLLLLLVALATLPGLRVLMLLETLAGEEEGSSPLEVRLLALRSGGAACCCRPRVLRTATGLGESSSSPLSDLSAGASVFDSGCDFAGVLTQAHPSELGCRRA